MGTRAGLDWCNKSSYPPGFDSRTVQPVAILYTDCAIFNVAFLMEIQSFLRILHKFFFVTISQAFLKSLNQLKEIILVKMIETTN